MTPPQSLDPDGLERELIRVHMQHPFDQLGDRSGVGTPSGPAVSASQRARDFLSAVRHEQQATRAESSAEQLLPVAYVVLAEEGIDGETAALALAKQLARPTDPDEADCAVGLLMIDPLGATLRLAGPGAQVSGPARRVGPQHRVSDRPGWDELLSRLPRSVAVLLVLDSTGQQHNLAAAADRPADDEDPNGSVTVIIVARTGADGRVSGYRKLKEVVEHGAGQVGFFFVEDGESASPPPRTPLPERAQSTHNRLATTAEQFLNRHVFFFGSTRDPLAATVRVEMLGQRPSLDRRENRQELTRWLADCARPLECERALIAHHARLVTDEELAELHERVPDVSEPTRAESPQDEAAGSPDVDVAAVVAMDPVAAADAAATYAQPGPSRGLAGSAGLAVMAVEGQPTDDQGLSRIIADHPQLLRADAVIGFRRAGDPALVLLYRAGRVVESRRCEGTLVLARPACGPDPLAGFASLVASIDWAEEHWDLIARAYPSARLGGTPQIEAVLILSRPPDDALKLLVAKIAGLRLARLVQLDLASVTAVRAAIGLAIEPL